MRRYLSRLGLAGPGTSLVGLPWLIHVGLTLFLALRLNIWTDEAYSLHTSAQGAGGALWQAIFFEQQPPVYFVALWLWRLPFASPVWARLLSVLCAALAVRLAAPLSRRYLPELHPAWATAVVALNPFVIYAAVEIRLYAMALLASALLLLLFHDGYLQEAPRRGARLAHALCALLAIHTQYFLGALLVAGACALLVLPRRRVLRAYLGNMALVGLCFLPMLTQVPRQFANHTGPIHDKPSLLGAGQLLAGNLLHLLLPVDGLAGRALRSWLPRLAALVLLALIALRVRRHVAPQRRAVWAIAAALLLCFLPVARLLGEPLLHQRHMVGLFLPITLAMLAALSAAPRWVRPAWLALLAVVYAAALGHSYGRLTKWGDWERVADYLMAHEGRGEPILAFHSSAALPLGVYYEGDNEVVPLPRDNLFDTYDVRRYVIESEEVLARRIAERAGDPQRLWLVTDGVCSWLGQVDHRCDRLESFVRTRYTVESDVRFYGTQVRLLQRRGTLASAAE